MKFLPVILFLAVATAGCTTKSHARAEARAAFLAGQNAALRQAAGAGVTVIGPVQNPTVPFVAGLTLAQAIATANFLGAEDPKQIILTRNGESAAIDPKVVLNGVAIPLEPGDVIELH